MSRIGKMPVEIPAGVEVKIENSLITVKGPKGQLENKIPHGIQVIKEENKILVKRQSDSKLYRSLHGLTRALIANMVIGVTQGFSKELEMVGVGYRATKKGENLEIQVGYSRPILFRKIAGIDFEVPAPNRIIIRGIDKQLVGQVAANIRAVRPPEPYKGKGIRYAGEYVRRKVGKAAK
jgi:large subunit ribosomal protein L6